MEEKEEFRKMLIVQILVFMMMFCVLFGVLTLVRTAIVG
jgi:hypothetical protein